MRLFCKKCKSWSWFEYMCDKCIRLEHIKYIKKLWQTTSTSKPKEATVRTSNHVLDSALSWQDMTISDTSSNYDCDSDSSSSSCSFD